jgi:hypothetical protein
MLELPTAASIQAQLTVSPHERSISCRIPMACSAQTVYALWADVNNWHTWDPDTKWARLDQAFASGSTGRLAPRKGMAVNLLISEATPHKSFTAESRVLGNRMIFSHKLLETGGGIVVIHQVQFQGWLAGLFMKTLGADVCQGLPLTLTRLKALCEIRQGISSIDAQKGSVVGLDKT